MTTKTKAKRPVGRPKIEFDLAKIAEHAEVGELQTEIGKSLGIPASSWQRRLREDPELREVIEIGRSAGSYAVLSKLKQQALRGGVGAIRLFLERVEVD